jgi:hypothetical protein
MQPLGRVSQADAPSVGRGLARNAPMMGDNPCMDPKTIKIVALVLIVCLVGMTFLGLLFF